MTHHKIIIGDCLEVLREMPSESVNMIITSPPYWGLRNYGEGTSTIWGGNPNCEHEWGERIPPRGHKSGKHGLGSTIGAKIGQDAARRGSGSSFCSKCGAWYGQLGLEPRWWMYVEHLVEISRELKRVLRKDGSYYLNLGDTYAGGGGRTGRPKGWEDLHGSNIDSYPRDPPAKQTGYDNVTKPKQKLLMPHRVAMALQEDGWICRNDITWHKRNPMPSSVKDRLNCTTEMVFHFVKSRKYYYDLDAIREPHKTSSIQRAGKSGVVSFNLRVRDVKRGKKGSYVASGKVKELTASQKEVESYIYPEGLTKHDMAVRRFPRVNRKGGVGYTDPLHVKPYHAKGKNPGDFWEINTRPYPDAHFAVYPEEICIKPILSSCPEWVCKKCGKPRERITKSRLPPLKDTEIKGMSSTQYGAHNAFSLGQRRQAYRALGYESPPAPETIGFTDCGCGAGFEGGVVLDLFLGRGTTTKVARDNGRNSIGIEIQPSYLPIIKKYLEIDQQRLGVMYEIIGAD